MHVDLLPLALAAIEDADSRAVLADALEESGWCTRANGIAVHTLMYQPDYQHPAEWDGKRVREWFSIGFDLARQGFNTGDEFLRAIAAVLLFGAWSDEMWPAARRRAKACPTVDVSYRRQP